MRIVKLILVLLLLSVVSFAQTPPPTNLKAILAISSTTNIKGVVLTWDYAQITTVLVNFNVYKKSGPLTSTTPFFKLATTNQRTYTDTQVASGMTYSYCVTAVINKVESAPSNQVQITIPSPPNLDAGIISGHLSDDSTKAPIANGNVIFFPVTATPAATNFLLIGGRTDNNGNFSTHLKAGIYYLYTTARGYIGEFYDNVRTIQNATKITLKANDSLYFSIGLTKGASITVISADPYKVNNFESTVNISSNGYATANSVRFNDETEVINGYELKQNYPNPFNPSTTISYQIPENNLVTLKIYNILGNEIATLVNEQQSAGTYNYNFTANNLASGIYIYRLQAGNYSAVRKFILLK